MDEEQLLEKIDDLKEKVHDLEIGIENWKFGTVFVAVISTFLWIVELFHLLYFNKKL